MIYLIRHSKTTKNIERVVQGRSDYPLSDIGIIETKEAAQAFKDLNIKIDMLYSSPLTRARQTISIFKQVLDLPLDINICDGLIERDFGEADGISYLDNDVEIKISTDYYPTMEKNADLEKRVFDSINKIAKANPDKNILIVSHSHAIKGILRSLDKSYTYLTSVPNLSVSILDYKNNKLEIVEALRRLI